MNDIELDNQFNGNKFEKSARLKSKLEETSKMIADGDLNAAAILAVKLTEEFPTSHLSWNILGNTYRRLNRTIEAEQSFRQATRVNSNSFESFLNLGLILKNQKYNEEAIAAFSRAHEINSAQPQVMFALANLFNEVGNFEKSDKYFIKTIDAKPKFIEQAYIAFSQALYNAKRYDAAIPVYKRILEHQPKNALVYNNLGNCFYQTDKLVEANQAYESAIKFKPDYSEAFTHLGLTFRGMGEKEKAVSAFEQAIKLNNSNSTAFLYLSELKTFNEKDSQIDLIKDLIDDPETTPIDRSNLFFTLAKAYEDIGKNQDAFLSYINANKIKKSLLNSDVKKDEFIFRRIKEASELLSASSIRDKPQIHETIPIFILGMPRSGTTLVEQIISSHSKVEGAGELKYAGRYGSNLTLAKDDIDYNHMETFQENYLSSLQSHSAEKQYITDKFPQNFMHIGLIVNSLPKAKIIHVRRNPKATCWSNFKNHFVFEGSAYNVDLEHVVTYYNLYHDLMNFWTDQFPNEIYTVDYEKLTEHPERETKKLLENIGLEWDDACLFPQNNKRHVTTASHNQVREKIYKGSSNDWKKFEHFLDEAFIKLVDH